MKIIHKQYYLCLFTVLSMALCGCPPLKHKIFIRNTTNDSVHITLLFQMQDTMTKRSIPVRCKNELVRINSRTLPQLDGTLLAYADNGRVTLALPSKSTAYISDIISSFYMFAHKSIIIQHSDISDTTTADYPYKNLKNFRRKRDGAYNYFYQTTLYYDIR